MCNCTVNVTDYSLNPFESICKIDASQADSIWRFLVLFIREPSQLFKYFISLAFCRLHKNSYVHWLYDQYFCVVYFWEFEAEGKTEINTKCLLGDASKCQALKSYVYDLCKCMWWNRSLLLNHALVCSDGLFSTYAVRILDVQLEKKLVVYSL